MIDTHLHLWQLERGDYDWITANRPILCRNYMPPDYPRFSEPHEFIGGIAVQAAPSRAATDFLLSLADKHDWILGVTGWADLTTPTVQSDLARWADRPTLKGIRPTAPDPGPNWLNIPELSRGLEALKQSGLLLEALVLPHQLQAVTRIAQAHPDLRIVINHAAKPKPDDMYRWSVDIGTLTDKTNVFCKVSGFTQQSTDPNHQKWVFNRLLDVFGPGRLMWGSDFPVLLETSDFSGWLDTTAMLLNALSPLEAKQVTTQTAREVYRLSGMTPA